MASGETSLVPFNKLSKKRQDELRAEYAKRVEDADKKRKPSMTERAANAVSELSPFTPEKAKRERREAYNANLKSREERYDSAVRAAEELESPRSRVLYGDDIKHRVDDMDAPAFKKGGRVSASKRADGIAQRGKTKGRMV